MVYEMGYLRPVMMRAMKIVGFGRLVGVTVRKRAEKRGLWAD